MKSAGLIYGDDSHYLDHLGTLCAILAIPLIVTDEKIKQIATKYYPKLSVIQCLPEEIIDHYRLIFTCLPRPLFDEIFFLQQQLLNKFLHTIWVPHGNSDKGRNSLFMEALKNEKNLLVYGKQMVDFLAQKQVLDRLKTVVLTGNFRYRFYKQNCAFYKKLVQEEILSFFKTRPQKILLYAPTWQDQEGSSSYLSASSLLLEKLPNHYALIVKPHPNLLKQQADLIEGQKAYYKERSNILFLDDFPPVYPLLDAADVYIGDMSSIGYDFLAFRRPLFFLNENRRDCDSDLSFYLAQSGVVIEKEEYAAIYDKIERSSVNKSRVQEQMYEYAFGKPKSFKALKQDIQKAARSCH